MALMISKQKRARKKQHKYDEEINLSSSNRVPVVKLSPSSMMDPVNLSLSNEKDKDVAVEMSGLIDTRCGTVHTNLASIIGSMVANTLGYPNIEKNNLVIQFNIYFEALGWKTESYMTASTETCLTILTELVLGENVVGMICLEIQLTLERIAQFTVTVRRQKLYLSKSTTFDELLDYHVSNCNSYQCKNMTSLLLERNILLRGLIRKYPRSRFPTSQAIALKVRNL